MMSTVLHTTLRTTRTLTRLDAARRTRSDKRPLDLGLIVRLFATPSRYARQRNLAVLFWSRSARCSCPR